MILHVTKDLMMSSTARSHAQSQGVEIAFANSMKAAIEKLQSGSYRLCLADLQMPGLEMEQLAEVANQQNASTIVYVQHVQVDTLAKAKEVGFGEVMTRGQFNKSLGQIMVAAKSSEGDAP